VFRGDSEINNGFSKWHSSEAIKKCHPSVLRGDSTKEPGGLFCATFPRGNSESCPSVFRGDSTKEPGGSFV